MAGLHNQRRGDAPATIVMAAVCVSAIERIRLGIQPGSAVAAASRISGRADITT
ncbi:hypothetical protein XHC_3099 [Xanthomonas hortorum pv. carotae str. M081]|nr:hypothetical protein XHC_3099 [Xanthomonas hortorum pv. carotae str. M081]